MALIRAHARALKLYGAGSEETEAAHKAAAAAHVCRYGEVSTDVLQQLLELNATLYEGATLMM